MPSTPASKKATFYIDLLRELWLDLHRFPAAIIDEDLAWTEQEAQRFAECAYEICRARKLLKFLERATEARLLVLVLSIEFEKVKKVLDKQQKQQTQALPPPPLLRQASVDAPVQSNGMSNSDDIPRFIPMNRIATPGNE